MRLIQSIQVEGFRSIQSASLTPLSGLTTFVGKNSSGKSNLLRALSLFFNNELEPGRPLVFARDEEEKNHCDGTLPRSVELPLSERT